MIQCTLTLPLPHCSTTLLSWQEREESSPHLTCLPLIVPWTSRSHTPCDPTVQNSVKERCAGFRDVLNKVTNSLVYPTSPEGTRRLLHWDKSLMLYWGGDKTGSTGDKWEDLQTYTATLAAYFTQGGQWIRRWRTSIPAGSIAVTHVRQGLGSVLPAASSFRKQRGCRPKPCLLGWWHLCTSRSSERWFRGTGTVWTAISGKLWIIALWCTEA